MVFPNPDGEALNADGLTVEAGSFCGTGEDGFTALLTSSGTGIVGDVSVVIISIA